MAGDICDLLCLDLSRAESLRKNRIDAEVAQAACVRAKALSDPTRLMIAHSLLNDELCVCDLAWVVERSEALTSHHVRVLRAAGIVSSRRHGRMVMYALTEQGCELLQAVVQTPAVPA